MHAATGRRRARRGPATPGGRRDRRDDRLLHVALWCVAWLLVALAVLRGAQVLDTSWEVAAVGISPLVLPVALPLAVASLAIRRWLLTVTALAVLSCWAAWDGPVLWPQWRAAPAVGVELRLFDANVSQSNRALAGIGSEITRDRPAVVVLEELTPDALSSLDATGVLHAFGWSILDPQTGSGGMGLWSRLPADGLHTWTVGDGQIELAGWLRLPDGAAIRLDGVHVLAPAFGADQPARWRRQLEAVRRHLADEPRPLVVAGDFNATADMAPLRRILDLGLSDAAVLAGRGWDMTWPRNQPHVPAYLRLDHVLLSGRLTVTSYRLGVGRGSDHRPLIVTLGRSAH